MCQCLPGRSTGCEGQDDDGSAADQGAEKDATTYRRSGGGITLSGGEPLVQYEFAAELLRACKAQGWDTAIETTGAGITEAVER